MVLRSMELETVCGITSKLPENREMELAFIGRSNVGKSSLINTMLNRKSLARTSSQPGKTQTINYYKINNAFYLVDLPGYGYAKVSKEMQQKWKGMIANYLTTSKALRVVFQLVDIRHEPTTKDIEMYNWLTQYGFSPVILATKSDKLKKSQIKQHTATIEKKMELFPDTPVIPFSSENKEGRDELWDYVEYFLEMFSEDFKEE